MEDWGEELFAEGVGVKWTRGEGKKDFKCTLLQNNAAKHFIFHMLPHKLFI